MIDDAVMYFLGVGHGYAKYHTRNHHRYVIARFVPLVGKPTVSTDLATMDEAKAWLDIEAQVQAKRQEDK